LWNGIDRITAVQNDSVKPEVKPEIKPEVKPGIRGGSIQGAA
jgi:hypothetical protein